MTTITDAETIHKLFDAYNDSTGFGVRFNLAWERQLYDAAQMGLTPEMLTLVLKERLKGVKSGDRKLASLMPRNLFYSEDIINEVLCEGAALMALKRKIIDPARASVLQATGRPADHGEPDQGPKLAKAVLQNCIEELRKAAI